MDTKRIRFGFVCRNATPSITVEMLGPLCPRSVECALVGEKQFVVFTIDKSMRAVDILNAVKGMGLELEQFEGCDGFIVTFEKGQQFLHHPFYRLVQDVRQEDAANGVVDAPQRFWQWVSDEAEPVKRKRLAEELLSDLVDDAITPSAPKREHVASSKEAIDKVGEYVFGRMDKRHCKHLGGNNKGHFTKSVSSVDVKLLSLVHEVSKSKDETIAAKNYAIQLLETMLKNSNGQTSSPACSL